MKYRGLPSLLWGLFYSSFNEALSEVYGYKKEKIKEISTEAKREYRRIIEELPEFEKDDRFKMNIVSCAMLGAYILHMEPDEDVKKMTLFYEKGMMNRKMKLFCKLSGMQKFSKKDVEGLKRTAAFKAADRNPYSWNMEFYPYEDGSGYEARFTKCGICTLMKELGLEKYTPALCHLDYSMSQAGQASLFVRNYTLASGGPYCDCGYKKRR